MRILLFGASGMLGAELSAYFDQYADIELIKASRLDCDISKIEQIEPFICKMSPDVIINTAAIVNIKLCEDEKSHAFAVNSLSVSKMALTANAIGARFVQISTDHYFYGDGNLKHTEDSSVSLLNYYAYTKFVGENYAMLAQSFLIIRTNIVGFRREKGPETFIEWAIRSLESHTQLTLFDDYFISSIDIYSFSKILKEMINKNLNGLYNVASSEVSSKADFIGLLAEKLNTPLNQPIYTSVNNQMNNLVKRPDSLGLDVSKIENDFGYCMPNVSKVISNICEVYNDIKKN